MTTLEKTLSIRLSPAERMAAEEYAKERGMTLSSFAREAILEKIEDARDLKVYNDWIKSKQLSVPFLDLVRECGFSEEDL